MSGLYIPDMDMPRSCGECLLSCDECFGSIKCERVKSWGSWRMRAIGCPLISVSSHGRIVDIDALNERIHGKERPEIYDGMDEVLWIEQCMREAETIIPADSCFKNKELNI